MRKKIFKRIISYLTSFMLLAGTILPAVTKAYASENITVTYDGVLYSYNSSGGRPAENMHGIFSSSTGNIAYCGEHGIPTPMSAVKGSSVSLPANEVSNSQIRKILYYGYGGVEQWSGFSSSAYNGVYQLFSGNDSTSKTQSAGISITAMALTEAYGGNGRAYDVSGLSEFKSYIAGKDEPPANFTVYMLSSGLSATQDMFTYRYVPNGELQLIKTVKNNKHLTDLCPENYSIKGAVYEVYADRGLASKAGEFVTDERGYTNKLSLLQQKYYIKEKTAPKGFKLDKTVYEVDVVAGQLNTFNVADEPIFDPLSLKIEKKAEDKADKNLSLEGAEYTVKYYKELDLTEETVKSATAFRTWVFATDKNGYLTLKDKWKVGGDELFKNEKGFPVGLFGTYTVEETKAPKGFAKTEGLISIQQVKQGTTTDEVVVLKDVVDVEKEQTVSIVINKKDSETLEAKPQGFGSLSGAVYRVEFWDAFTNEFLKVAELITDEQGVAKYENGKAGVYRITETKASRGYLVDEAVKEIKAGIKEINTANFEYVVDSLEKVITITVDKITVNEKGEKISLAGAELELVDEKGDSILTFVSDGKAKKIKGLKAGQYTIRELKAPKGYEKIEKDVEIEIKDTSDIQEFEVYNAPLGKLELIKSIEKSTADFNVLKEVDFTKIKFGLYDEKDNLISEHNLDIDGKLTVDNLELGSYYVKEIETLPGLVLDETKYRFELSDKKDKFNIHQEMKVENKYTKVKVSKTDITGDKELAGAKLTIKDNYGKEVVSFVSKDKATYIDGLEKGRKYTLTEEIAPKGYVLSKKSVEFTIKEDGSVTGAVIEDKVLSVKKTDEKGKILTGAEFEIISKNTGKVVDKFTSSDSVYTASNLVEGEEYILREKVVPKGYEKGEDIVFKVKEDGENQQITVINKAIKPVIKTADERDIVITVSLMMLSFLGIVLISRKRKNS